jgi:hypothetical protein
MGIGAGTDGGLNKVENLKALVQVFTGSPHRPGYTGQNTGFMEKKKGCNPEARVYYPGRESVPAPGIQRGAIQTHLSR